MKNTRLLIETFIHIHFCKVTDEKRKKKEKANEKNRSPKWVLGILDEIHQLMTTIFLWVAMMMDLLLSVEDNGCWLLDAKQGLMYLAMNPVQQTVDCVLPFHPSRKKRKLLI